MTACDRFALRTDFYFDCFGKSVIRDRIANLSKSYNKIGATMNPRHTDIATIIVPGTINE